jgi:hypothetical protein
MDLSAVKYQMFVQWSLRTSVFSIAKMSAYIKIRFLLLKFWSERFDANNNKGKQAVEHSYNLPWNIIATRFWKKQKPRNWIFCNSEAFLSEDQNFDAWM